MTPSATTSEPSEAATWGHRLQLGASIMLRNLRGVTRAAADRSTKRLFLAAYEASDDAYWRHHATQCEWRSLGGIIEYTTDLLAVPRKGAAPIYLIAIKATSDTDLQRVVIKVKAKKSGIIYQQEITQDKLCSIPVRKALTVIPRKPNSSTRADERKLGDIYIRLAETVDRDGVDLIKRKKISDIFPATSTDSAPHRHVKRWEQYWNIEAIDVEKENIKTRHYRELVQSAKKLGRPLTMRRMAYRLLASRLGLSVTFWYQNLWNAEGIRASISQAEVNNRPLRGENSASTKLPVGGPG